MKNEEQNIQSSDELLKHLCKSSKTQATSGLIYRMTFLEY